jgi:hypothetical protein
VTRADRLGERALEGLDRRPRGQEIRPQGLGHRGDVVILDGLPAVGEHAVGHGQSVARRRRV